MPETRRILLGASHLVTTSAEVIALDLGPEHPSRAGHLEIALDTDGGRIVGAEAIPGAMHRGVEKLFEVRDYRQILSLADRHDWQAPFFGELAAAMAFESALGIEVPDRAVWLRTLLCEHFRLHSHLAFLSWVWHALAPAPDMSAQLQELREGLRLQARELTGNRVHPMLNRIGGVAADVSPEWLNSESRLAAAIAALGAPLEASLKAAPRGVARLGESEVAAYGLSGPTARAAGLHWDLRPGSLAYDDCGIDLRSGVSDADAVARLLVQTRELAASAAVIESCATWLGGHPGPYDVDLPKILRVPEGDVLVELEGPLGVTGVFLVARGEKTPWRLKLRTPSFANVSALESALVGCPLEHLELAIASIGYVTGDLDK